MIQESMQTDIGSSFIQDVHWAGNFLKVAMMGHFVTLSRKIISVGMELEMIA